jgi:hypothetical protein
MHRLDRSKYFVFRGSGELHLGVVRAHWADRVSRWPGGRRTLRFYGSELPPAARKTGRVRVEQSLAASIRPSGNDSANPHPARLELFFKHNCGWRDTELPEAKRRSELPSKTVFTRFDKNTP